MILLALVVALAALMMAAAPALADDNGLDCRNVSGPGIRCDHQLFLPVNNQFAFCNDNFVFDCRRVEGFNSFFEPTPALEFNQEAENTGNVTISTAVSQTGNNSNQCVAPLQFGNTGNVQNAQGFTTFGSTPFFFNNNDNNINDNNDNGFFDHHRRFLFPFFNNGLNNNDIEFEGSSMTFTPTLTNTCNQAVEQAGAAGD
jgi:hypothetical protein